MAQYGTSTATYTFTLPGKDSGCGPAVGHGSTVPHESIV